MRDEILKKELWDMVRNTTVNLQTAFKPIVEVYGLTTIQSRILVAVKECDNVNIGTISKIIDMSSSNVSNICKRLEKDCFITRKRSSQDERIVELELTEKGEKALQEIMESLKNSYGPILSSKTEEEFNSIIKGINALNELLKEFEENINK